MPPRKKRPVLFELIGRSQRRGKPPLTRPAPTLAPLKPASAPPPAAPAPRQIPPTAARTPPTSTPPRPSRQPIDWSAWIPVDALPLAPWMRWAFGGVGVVVLIALAYYIGTLTLPKPAPKSSSLDTILTSPADTATEQPGGGSSETPQVSGAHRSGAAAVTPAPPPTEPTRDDPAPAPTPPPAETSHAPNFEFKSGYNYLVVQHVKKKDRDAAERIRDYLVSNGVGCVVVDSGPDVVVICVDAFPPTSKNKSKAAAESKKKKEYSDRIRQLGREYAVPTGYSFDRCYWREQP